MIYTYDGLLTEIQNRLGLLSDWAKVLFHGVYERIIDLLAYTGVQLVYLAEFLYRESKWISAEKRKSLITMGKLLSYTPYRKSGAIGELILSADPNFSSIYTYTGKEVRISKWTVFTNTDISLFVYCTEDTFYYTGTIGNISIPVKQGTPKQMIYTSSGAVNEKIYLYSDAIDNSEFEVYIIDSNNNILYTAILTTNLYLIDNLTDYYYTIENSSEYDYVIFTFGDGITTRKLNTNERILIKYADTLGTTGNITSSNVITVIQDILFDEDNNEAILYVNNLEAITDGSDIEDIESIRNNAPNLFQVGMLLSSRSNWESVINSAPYVNKCRVWTAEDVGESVTASEQNIVYISAVSSSGEDLTDAQENDLSINYITPKKCLTETISFTPLQAIFARMVIDAKIVSTQTSSIATATIKNAVSSTYGITYTEFQNNIYESNVYSLIDNLTDVIFHTTQIYYLEKNINVTVSNATLATSYTSTETVLPDFQNYLVQDSFEIWIKRKIAGEWEAPLQIGYSTGTSIYGMNGYTISGGYLIYASNKYSFTVAEIVADVTHVIYGIVNPGDSDLLGYILYISYKMQDGNVLAGQTNSIRLPYFYMITNIDEDFIDVNISYMS